LISGIEIGRKIKIFIVSFHNFGGSTWARNYWGELRLMYILYLSHLDPFSRVKIEEEINVILSFYRYVFEP
jgi:hypothetical protein